MILQNVQLPIFSVHFFSFAAGKTVSLDPNTTIVVPEDRHGLYAIDVLDPDLVRMSLPLGFHLDVESTT